MKNKTKRFFLIVVLLIFIATLSPTNHASADDNPNVNVIALITQKFTAHLVMARQS